MDEACYNLNAFVLIFNPHLILLPSPPPLSNHNEKTKTLSRPYLFSQIDYTAQYDLFFNFFNVLPLSRQVIIAHC